MSREYTLGEEDSCEIVYHRTYGHHGHRMARRIRIIGVWGLRLLASLARQAAVHDHESNWTMSMSMSMCDA